MDNSLFYIIIIIIIIIIVVIVMLKQFILRPGSTAWFRKWKHQDLPKRR